MYADDIDVNRHLEAFILDCIAPYYIYSLKEFQNIQNIPHDVWPQ